MAPRNTRKMYRVSLSGPSMAFGGLGRAATSWGSGRIDADSREEAIEIARRQCAEKFDEKYARGKATVVELSRFKVTVRNRDDKRKRATFIIVASSEKEAVTFARYNPSLTRFAGYLSTHPERGNLVSVRPA